MLVASPDRSPVLRLIEFIGAPSAGKSTLLHAVLTGPGRAAGWVDGALLARRPRLSVAGRRAIAASSGRPTLATLLLGARSESDVIAALDAAAPLLGPLLARAGRGSDPDEDPVLRGLVLRWGLEAAAVRALVERARTSPSAPAIVALDEGLTHPYKLAAFGGTVLGPDELAILPLPDVLVHVDVTPSSLVARLRRRREGDPTGPRTRSWPDDDALGTEAARLLATVAAVVDEAVRRRVPVVAVDADRRPDDAARDLVDDVAGALRGVGA